MKAPNPRPQDSPHLLGDTSQGVPHPFSRPAARQHQAEPPSPKPPCPAPPRADASAAGHQAETKAWPCPRPCPRCAGSQDTSPALECPVASSSPPRATHRSLPLPCPALNSAARSADSSIIFRAGKGTLCPGKEIINSKLDWWGQSDSPRARAARQAGRETMDI